MLNRTDLTEEARLALEAECMIRRAGLKEIASELIMNGISERAKEVMVLLAKDGKVESPKESRVEIVPEGSPAPVPISESEGHVIREMYAQNPRPSFAKIGEAVGRHKGVVYRWIKQNIEEEEKP